MATLTSTNIKSRIKAALADERRLANLNGYYDGEFTREYADAKAETDRLVALVDLDVQNTD